MEPEALVFSRDPALQLLIDVVSQRGESRTAEATVVIDPPPQERINLSGYFSQRPWRLPGNAQGPDVCPAKAGMFSRGKACRGKNQRLRSLDSRVAGNQDSEAYRQRLPWGGDESPGRNEMTKASIDLQDLRRRIYVKAKAETSWKFWGLYVQVCKLETLREAYALAKRNDGAPGSDGVTFEAIEAQGVEAFLEQIADELVGRSYAPLPARRQEIPKDGGKVRVLSIPAIRDRVAQGALKLILEPIFEADFQPGSFGIPTATD